MWARIGFCLCFGLAHASVTGAVELHQSLSKYVDARVKEFGQIDAERRERLAAIAAYVRQQKANGEPVRLVFICTHNSRRSQLAQVWSAVAAAHYGVTDVETFSGGTEATAFNSRAVDALNRAGVSVKRQLDSAEPDNPRYVVSFADSEKPLQCFSKRYGDSPNPVRHFAAVMTCSEADQGCPNVGGAEVRIVLPFEDPKAADGAAEETATYDARCAQIAREMLYVFASSANGT